MGAELRTYSQQPLNRAGSSVILIEGFFEETAHFSPLRDSLTNSGFRALPSPLGRNLGLSSQQIMLEEYIKAIIIEEGEVYLVGHSLGGRMALEASRRIPGVKKVATLGSPVADIPVPLDVEVLCATGMFDMVVPIPFSIAQGKNVQIQVFPTEHIGLIYSTSTHKAIGKFLAA